MYTNIFSPVSTCTLMGFFDHLPNVLLGRHAGGIDRDARSATEATPPENTAARLDQELLTDCGSQLEEETLEDTFTIHGTVPVNEILTPAMKSEVVVDEIRHYFEEKQDKLQGEIAKTQEDLAEMKSKFAAKKKLYKEAKMELQKVTRNLDQEQKMRKEAEKKLDHNSSAQEEQCLALNTEIETLREKLNDNRTVLKTQEGELKSMATESEAMKALLDSKEGALRKKEQELETARKNLVTTEQTLDRVKKDYDRIREKLELTATRCKDDERQYQEKLKRIEKEREDIEKKCRETEENLGKKCGEIEELTQAERETSEAEKKAEVELNELLTTLDSVTQKLSAAAEKEEMVSGITSLKKLDEQQNSVEIGSKKTCSARRRRRWEVFNHLLKLAKERASGIQASTSTVLHKMKTTIKETKLELENLKRDSKSNEQRLQEQTVQLEQTTERLKKELAHTTEAFRKETEQLESAKKELKAAAERAILAEEKVEDLQKKNKWMERMIREEKENPEQPIKDPEPTKENPGPPGGHNNAMMNNQQLVKTSDESLATAPDGGGSIAKATQPIKEDTARNDPVKKQIASRAKGGLLDDDDNDDDVPFTGIQEESSSTGREEASSSSTKRRSGSPKIETESSATARIEGPSAGQFKSSTIMRIGSPPSMGIIQGSLFGAIVPLKSKGDSEKDFANNSILQDKRKSLESRWITSIEQKRKKCANDQHSSCKERSSNTEQPCVSSSSTSSSYESLESTSKALGMPSTFKSESSEETGQRKRSASKPFPGIMSGTISSGKKEEEEEEAKKDGRMVKLVAARSSCVVLGQSSSSDASLFLGAPREEFLTTVCTALSTVKTEPQGNIVLGHNDDATKLATMMMAHEKLIAEKERKIDELEQERDMLNSQIKDKDEESAALTAQWKDLQSRMEVMQAELERQSGVPDNSNNTVRVKELEDENTGLKEKNQRTEDSLKEQMNKLKEARHSHSIEISRKETEAREAKMAFEKQLKEQEENHKTLKDQYTKDLNAKILDVQKLTEEIDSLKQQPNLMKKTTTTLLTTTPLGPPQAVAPANITDLQKMQQSNNINGENISTTSTTTIISSSLKPATNMGRVENAEQDKEESDDLKAAFFPDNSAAAFLMKESERNKELVERNKEVVEKNKKLIEENKDLSTQLQQSREAMTAAKTEFCRNAERTEKNNNKIDELKQSFEKERARLKEREEEITKQKGEIVKLEAEVKSASGKLREFEKAESVLKQELAKCEKTAREHYQAPTDEKAKFTEAHNNKVKELELAISSHKQQLEAKQSQIADLTQALNLYRTQKENAEKELAASQLNVSRLETQVAALKQKLERLIGLKDKEEEKIALLMNNNNNKCDAVDCRRASSQSTTQGRRPCLMTMPPPPQSSLSPTVVTAIQNNSSLSPPPRNKIPTLDTLQHLTSFISSPPQKIISPNFPAIITDEIPRPLPPVKKKPCGTRRKALLVSAVYRNSLVIKDLPNHMKAMVGKCCPLVGCETDLYGWIDLLRDVGWSRQNVRILSEARSLAESPNVKVPAESPSRPRMTWVHEGQPTLQNLLEGLEWLTCDIVPGDRILLVLLGAGCLIPIPPGTSDHCLLFRQRRGGGNENFTCSQHVGSSRGSSSYEPCFLPVDFISASSLPAAAACTTTDDYYVVGGAAADITVSAIGWNSICDHFARLPRGSEATIFSDFSVGAATLTGNMRLGQKIRPQPRNSTANATIATLYPTRSPSMLVPRYIDIDTMLEPLARRATTSGLITRFHVPHAPPRTIPSSCCSIECDFYIISACSENGNAYETNCLLSDDKSRAGIFSTVTQRELRASNFTLSPDLLKIRATSLIDEALRNMPGSQQKPYMLTR